MREPFRSEFVRCLEAGAGRQDIHDVPPEAGGYAAMSGTVLAEYYDREINRVSIHQRSLCPLLESHVGRVTRILDVGCSTGGTTVALALSKQLDAREVVGIDPNALSIAAGPVRARAHGVDDRVRFMHVPPGRLPFEDGWFDLVVSVSVLEFITRKDDRRRFVAELKRVVRPGGHVFVATPSPLRMRELHTRRFLGDYRKRDGLPWSTGPFELRSMFSDFVHISLGRDIVQAGCRKLGIKKAVPVPPPLIGWVQNVTAWQKLLVRKVMALLLSFHFTDAPIAEFFL